MRRKSFAPALLEAFKRLRAAYETGECTCPPRPPDVYPPPQWKHGDPLFIDPPPRCDVCQRYAQAEGEVIALLHLKPWQELQNPYFRNPYPKGTPAWQERENKKQLKHDDHGGYALWWTLEAACGLEPLLIDDDDDDDVVVKTF